MKAIIQRLLCILIIACHCFAIGQELLSQHYLPEYSIKASSISSFLYAASPVFQSMNASADYSVSALSLLASSESLSLLDTLGQQLPLAKPLDSKELYSAAHYLEMVNEVYYPRLLHAAARLLTKKDCTDSSPIYRMVCNDLHHSLYSKAAIIASMIQNSSSLSSKLYNKYYIFMGKNHFMKNCHNCSSERYICLSLKESKHKISLQNPAACPMDYRFEVGTTPYIICATRFLEPKTGGVTGCVHIFDQDNRLFPVLCDSTDPLTKRFVVHKNGAWLYYLLIKNDTSIDSASVSIFKKSLQNINENDLNGMHVFTKEYAKAAFDLTTTQFFFDSNLNAAVFACINTKEKSLEIYSLFDNGCISSITIPVVHPDEPLKWLFLQGGRLLFSYLHHNRRCFVFHDYIRQTKKNLSLSIDANALYACCPQGYIFAAIEQQEDQKQFVLTLYDLLSGHVLTQRSIEYGGRVADVFNEISLCEFSGDTVLLIRGQNKRKNESTLRIDLSDITSRYTHYADLFDQEILLCFQQLDSLDSSCKLLPLIKRVS